MYFRTSLRVLLPLLLAGLVPACGGASSKPRTGSDGGGGQGNSGVTGTGANGGASVAGMSSGIGLSGASTNPCLMSAAPDTCMLVPSGPACGDGKKNQDSEDCDDGNSLPGDGCSGACKVEAYSQCLTPGAPCVSTIVCGDGTLGPGEACDDGNAAAGDGCSANCRGVEPHYVCRVPGQPCAVVHVCGDAVVDTNEGCDDGKRDNGDGCDARCRIEVGFKCAGAPSVCSSTTCGDKKVEGAESCDDGNQVSFDGCSATCRSEPSCGGAACTSKCGDGIVLGESCDDGNLRDGDGCSSACAFELGHKCNNNPPCVLVDGKCTMTVPAVFRDFNPNAMRLDFEPSGDNQVVIPNLVDPVLDADGKPVYRGTGGAGVAAGAIASKASFAKWYRDSPPDNSTIPGMLTLWDNAKGGFVNRWGPNGEPWKGYEDQPNWNCGQAGQACAQCSPLAPGQVCLDPCLPYNNLNQACAATEILYDGNPVFFPIDNHPNALLDTRTAAVIPPQYGMNWQPEPGGALHNFHFTTEVRYWFSYDPAIPARLDFTGDDDVWVFVNRRLAVDLGGWHIPVDGTVTIDAAAATRYQLEPGKVYEIAVFQAERKTKGSSFRLTLSGFNMSPSECVTDCGDGVVAAGEECDDGLNNSGKYNECTLDCRLGPRCGDLIRQEPDEACDDGINDGSWGGCAPNCQLGPRCGDSVVQPEHEQCDDGQNDGGYGECAPGCVLGPFCGDSRLAVPFEECDDGNNKDADSCSAACKTEVPVLK